MGGEYPSGHKRIRMEITKPIIEITKLVMSQVLREIKSNYQTVKSDSVYEVNI